MVLSASSDEAHNSYFTQAPQIVVPAPVADHPIRWFVERQYKVYANAKIPNNKLFMTQTLTLERRVLIASLRTMPVIYAIFTRHWLEWMAPNVERYGKEMVREFYESDVATPRS